MAQYSKLQVLQAIRETGVVPVFYNGDADIAKSVLKAAYDGGIRVFEFTNRGDFAHEVFSEIVKYAVRELPGMILGAGSIVDPATAALYIQLGANFIVGPVLNEEIVPICNRRLIPYCPGCASVSEVGRAQELGCDLCKVFPGEVLTPAFVKSVKAPMPWCQLMVTGGVDMTRENLEGWFNAGAFCVGMGTKLLLKDAVAGKDWNQISDNCRTVIGIIKRLKK